MQSCLEVIFDGLIADVRLAILTALPNNGERKGRSAGEVRFGQPPQGRRYNKNVINMYIQK